MRTRLRAMALAVALAAAAVPSASAASAATTATDTAVGTYYPVTSGQRVLDTRTGNGAAKAPVAARTAITVAVGGRSGVPVGDGASAVVLNLTGVAPTANTFLSAYSSQGVRPAISSLNVARGATRANLVTVPVGTDGRIRIYNNAGSVNVVADVMGYYARTDISPTKGIGGMYELVRPLRLFDSRDPGYGKLLPGEGYDMSLDFEDPSQPDVHNVDVRAYAVNVTTTGATGAGFVTAWDGAAAAPNASTVNYGQGLTVPNMAIVPARLDGGVPTFSVQNGSGTRAVHVVVDVVGVFMTNQPRGFRYDNSFTPQRVVDTRNGTGSPKSPLGPGPKAVRDFTVPAPTAVDATYVLMANATVTAATAATFVTLYDPSDPEGRPSVSNLNAAVGETAANAAFIPLAPGNVFRAYNNAGNVQFITDVVGRFDLYTTPTTALAPSSAQRSDVVPHRSGATQR